MVKGLLLAAAAMLAAPTADHRGRPAQWRLCSIPDTRPAQASARPLASWLEGAFTIDDYPASALREEFGDATTRVSLTLGVEGRITDCRVLRSSGSAALDTAACRILTRRVCFWPALDSHGRPISLAISHDVRWTMPPPILPPLLHTD